MEVQDIRVLIVDDSALMRNLISRVVEQSPGLTVVGNPAAVVITSSPFFKRFFPSFGDIRAEIARRFALEPEFTVETYFTPRYFENSFSNSSLKRPDVSHISRVASIILSSSSTPRTLPEAGI